MPSSSKVPQHCRAVVPCLLHPEGGREELPVRRLTCSGYKEAVRRGVTSGLCFSRAQEHMLKCFAESKSRRVACQKCFMSIPVTVTLTLSLPATSVYFLIATPDLQKSSNNVFQLSTPSQAKLIFLFMLLELIVLF